MTDDLVHRVGETINRYSMLSKRDRVGVAVSGGADSVFLLHALRALAPDWDIVLHVLHVNHHLRGEESEGDEQFVRDLANSFELPFTALQGPVGKGNLEQSAREIRNAFFQDAKTQFGLNRLALGHNRSDQAETVLFRLLRGSGTAGLAGMSPVSHGWLIRPLFALGRAEIRDFLDQKRIQFREDSSNQNLAFARNRLRLTTIPELTASFNPRLEEVLAGTAEIARVEEEWWATKIQRLYLKIAKRTNLGLLIEVKWLHKLHLSAQRRVLRRAVRAVRGDLRSIDRLHVDAIVKICKSSHGHDRVNIPGVDAIRSFDHLLLAEPEMLKTPRDYYLKLKRGVPVRLPYQAGFLELAETGNSVQICGNVENTAYFRYEEALLNNARISTAVSADDLAVRNWQPGDKLQRAGRGSTDKIKTLFQEHGVFLWDRKHWPVVVAGNEIVWVRGFGVAEQFAARKESRDSVRICFEAKE